MFDISNHAVKTNFYFLREFVKLFISLIIIIAPCGYVDSRPRSATLPCNASIVPLLSMPGLVEQLPNVYTGHTNVTRHYFRSGKWKVFMQMVSQFALEIIPIKRAIILKTTISQWF